MKLSFLGATGTVTGSKYLVQHDNKQILVDCGMFQGVKELRDRNWQRLPVDPSSIEAVVLTHAHIDHTGYLPLLVKLGFKNKIYCTSATYDLCKILLPDAGHLQEEDAFYANKKKFSRHQPALPLFTVKDAQEALTLFQPIDYESEFTVAGLSCKFSQAGHILGSAFVFLNDGHRSLMFSGDLGRPNDLVMLPPRWMKQADYLVLESTYGGRLHPPSDILDQLEAAINKTAKRGGAVIVPAFSVGRTQTLLYALQLLKKAHRISDIPVYLDSPMSIAATELLRTHQLEHRLNEQQCESTCNVATYTRTVDESKSIAKTPNPKIVISASGMATGGRILHHLKTFLPDHRNTVLLTGYQAAGTRGAQLLGKEKQVKIHGELVDVKAELMVINNLSAHSDQHEILAWLSHFQKAPKKVFITHGEQNQSEALKAVIEEKLHWTCMVPAYLDAVELD